MDAIFTEASKVIESDEKLGTESLDKSKYHGWKI
jgi:hypothetical protein